MKNYKTIAEAYTAALKELYGSEEAKQLFYLVFTSITGKARIQYSLMLQETVSTEQQQEFEDILIELASGRPVQHILGKADFYGASFVVNPQTLIPRPETEELVDLIINNNHSSTGLSVLDVGTGSGCIAISLQKHLKAAQVTAVDVSAEAIAVARENSKIQDAPVNFILADILEWDSFFQNDQQYDIIVSNPPYITIKEQAEMHENVLRFEPHSALFVEEQAPLLFYDVIADLALAHLKTEGSLYFEINQYLGPETLELLQKKGFSTVNLYQDINGVDRMIHAKRNKE